MKILIADDDLTSRTMLAGILTDWGYEVTVTSDGDEARRALEAENAPKLAILDWVMPGMDGNQVCQAVRKRQTDRYTYILLVTAKVRTEDIIRGLEAGADDYLHKPFDPLELKARLIAGRRILDLQERLIVAQEVLRHQATTDVLTGGWNHRAIIDILIRELGRAQRESRPLGIVLADIDHFKRINDTVGHLAGDAVLREVVRRMGTAMRPYDFIGRYGGEEFLVVMPGCDRPNALKLVERLRESIASEPIIHHEKPIIATASFGVVVYTPPGPVEVFTYLHAADSALYLAKRQGRNRVEISSMDTAVDSRTDGLPGTHRPHSGCGSSG